MKIDEAIEHAEEVARTCDDSQCAAEHMQLAEWLKKARNEKAKKMSVSMIRKLKAENAELRELATDACTVLRSHYDKDWFDGTVLAERMRDLGIEAEE